MRAAAAAIAISLVAAPFAGRPEDIVTLTLSLLLTALIFGALGVVTGVWAETFDQHAFVANIVVTPLALLAGVFYSARSLEEPWRTLTKIDPLYYLVDAARSGSVGFHEASVNASLGFAALAAAGAFAGAVVAVSWSRTLRP